MNPRAIDTKAAARRMRRRTTGKNRRSPHPTQQWPPRGRGGTGRWVAADTQKLNARTMRYSAWVGLLTALLAASVAHAITHRLTPGLVLGLALTALLLLASLALWRVGSRRKHDDTPPPSIER